MKKLKKLWIVLAVLFCFLCFSCSQKDGPYGKRIEEDLETTNIIDDNYRNYYEIFVRSFYDSNNDGIGDLQGVIQKLDYIEDLGFTGIWLMPINSSNSYHKYDVMDYYSVDKSYGDINDLKELISECHKRNIKLILDLVLNHSSSSNPMFIKAKAAHEKALANMPLTEEEEMYQDFYCFYDSRSDIPSTKTCYPVGSKGYYYEANFSSNMPEFNCDNVGVQEEFKKIMKYYLDMGIDGFRLDAVKYFYMESQAKTIEFLSKLNQWAKEINPNAYMVGECWDSSLTIEKYYSSGIDSFFNFATSVNDPAGCILNSLNLEGRSLNRYYEGLLNNVKIAQGGIPAPFLDNHDMDRFTSISNIRKTKYQYALLAMMNGATFTYYGDEIGMIGSNSGSNPDENVRIPMFWGESEGTCKSLEGATEEDYLYDCAKDQIEDPYSIYSFYKKCNLIRNQNPEIARGEISLIEMDKEGRRLYIKKTYQNSEIGILFNFSSTDDLNVDYKQLGFSNVIGQLVVDQKDKYIGLQKDGSILMPSFSIAIVK
ncbi:MAG: hypothetical protein K2H02_03140 [Anaeroplasmataceae bacterium]|nr:hypothetical protein [Anaeroplasmataceae bacterium]